VERTGVGRPAYIGFFIEMKEELTVNGLRVVLDLVKSGVFIDDHFNDVSHEEAEKIVNYLYAEGFIEDEKISLEVGKRGYYF
tara:strand:- start:31 stop:276 length:246 start_codon:yes stop_codon:yes gene_type:complete